MMMALDVPDEVVMPPVLGVASHDGEVCQQLLDSPAGAWTAVVLEAVDVSKLSALELPAYLQGLARVQAWAGAHIAAGVVRLAAMPEVDNPAAEVSFALSEPHGAAQRRVWQSRRLLRWLPATWRAMAAGDLSERHVSKLIDATATVIDPDLLARIEEATLARPGPGRRRRPS